MANTFTQLHIHIVFSVRHRASIIRDEWREDLHRYIAGIVQNKGHKMLAINSMPDHIHIFIGLKPDVAVSDIVRDMKANSSRWINEEKRTVGRFEWQEGYDAFSYAHSQVGDVIAYVRNQQEHLRTKTFREEYIEFLHQVGVPYDPKYVFDVEEQSRSVE